LSDDSTIQARGFDFDRKKAGNSGTTKLASFGFLMNGAYRIKNKMELFWTGAMNNLTLVFVNQYVTPRNTSWVNTLLFPDGYKSRVRINTWNVSAIAGAKGKIGNEIHWEYSSAYGLNTPGFHAENTNNASQQDSLGKNAPTKFYTGTQFYHQLTNTIHFTKNFSTPGEKLKAINLGWGAELRFENFRLKAGEEASWRNYDISLRKQGLQLSQVISPDDALDKNRRVLCAYVDFEADLADRFLINLASRFEHYSDFGGNLAGKLAARYKLFDKLSLRGSVGNGFRAPSMQQRYYSFIGFGTKNSGAGQTAIRRGIFNNDHKVTKLFGVPSLEAEKSLNLSLGLTSSISKQISLTIDAYWIQIKNRILLSGAFNRKNPEVDSLLRDPSLNNYSNIDEVTFFANAINTTTQGIDAVIHGKWNIHKAQLIAVLAANFTRTRLFGDIKTAANLSATAQNKNTLFNEEQRASLEKGQPRSKVILSFNYKKQKIGFILRNTRFDKTVVYNIDSPDETFSPKILTDVSMSYTPKSWLTITTGGNNIFDVYPDRIINYLNTNEGKSIYSAEGSPFGFMGGYYYVSMSFNF
jgi:iron complex outermembrane receptor protein